ncbi:BLUF domain-containing protein [Sphingomicrobium sp. B8]|uniref:BLUF domain-containing protein n=1 Tax=Sphingomicrobium clamense TaxID=2851013 RepID=A0ABS6V6T1_9SPHN|nr:BLUF domain-containing protein [Sphingomicrobium sp. B8]
MLEGNGREVDRTFARIRDDARHSAVVQLRVREVDHRAFPDWNMAYQQVRGPGEEDLIFIVGAMVEQLDDPLLRDELMGFAMLHNAA